MYKRQVPVVVDFWAEWCGPCRTLGPTLERLEAEANGAWILAKVDVDTNQGLAATFGVQGIPAVHAFKDGREANRFVGALPEEQVRQWLRTLGPSEGELIVERARAAEGAGDTAAALELYRSALNHEPGNDEAKAGVARLELAERATGADASELETRLNADPADVDAAAGLADLRFAAGDVAGATSLLVDVIRRTTGDDRDRARAHLVSLLDTLAPDDPRAMDARRELAAALF